MDNDEQDVLAGKIVLFIMALIILTAYLFPWLLPLFYDMPERTTLPYYALLLAIEMSPFVKSLKEDAQNKD